MWDAYTSDAVKKKLAVTLIQRHLASFVELVTATVERV